MAMTGAPGNGQLTLADVVGTVFTTKAAPEDKLFRTHTLVAVASLPKIAGTPDPSSNFGVTPTIHGCSIYRYNAQNLPGADGDAGDVTFSGFNATTTVGVNAATGSGYPMSSGTPITCKRGATDMLYHCAYAGSAGPDAGAAGADTGSVVFPAFPFQVCSKADPSVCPVTIPVSQGGWPLQSETGCIDRFTYNPNDPNAPGQGGANTCLPTDMTTCTTLLKLCEQQPIIPLGVSEITEKLAGGTDWPMAMQTLGNGGGLDGGVSQLAGPLYIAKVTTGTLKGTETDITGHDLITGGNNLDIADGAIDPTKDLNIYFSCDPNQPTTPGAGCTGSQDLVGLLITTSTSPKTAFALSTATGSATCSQSVSAMSTITVAANQLTAMLGGQTGGSYQIALVRLTTKLQSPAGTHPLLAFTAGMGVFGFTNQ
ncbi:MAG TPA: hypothetical protein VF334_11355, partial [Polyangia bacterium]